MKKVLAVILASIMMILLMSVGVSAVGDTMATATKVAFGTKYTGTIDTSNTRDFYKIILSESGKLTINTTVFEDMYYGLYNEDGGTLDSEALLTSYTAGGFRNEIIAVHLTSGTYYFDHHRCGANGDYQVKFTFESANETVKEGSGVSNDSMRKAFDIELNKKYQGQIARNEDKDFYKFVIKDKSKVKIDLNVFPYVYCAVGDENGAIVSDFRLLGYDYNIHTSHELELDSGVYYIWFSKSNGTCGNYNFKISEVGTITPDEPITPDNPDEPPTPDDPDSSDESFFAIIWRFLVNVFMFLFGWIIDLF